jgi:hypothetical protein
MIIYLQRDKGQAAADKQTLGKLIVGDHTFFTMELPWKDNTPRESCIPTGTYNVEKRYTDKHGNHFHILDVPNRDWILIHSANFVTELLGCIAPGLSQADINGDGLIDITSSKAAMEQLNDLLPDQFQLVIS